MAAKNKFDHRKFGVGKLQISGDSLPYLPFIIMTLGVLIFFSLISFDDGELGKAKNIFGVVGWGFGYGLFYLLGRGAYQLAILGIVYGFIFLQKRIFDGLQILLSCFLLVLTTSIYANAFETTILSLKEGGGVIGTYFSGLAEYVIGTPGRFLVNSFLFIYSLLIILKYAPNHKFIIFFYQLPNHAWKLKNQIEEKYRLWQMEREKATKPVIETAKVSSSSAKETVGASYQSKSKKFYGFITNDEVPWVEVKKVKVGANASSGIEQESEIEEVIESKVKVKYSDFSEEESISKAEYGLSTVYETFVLPGAKGKANDSFDIAKPFDIMNYKFKDSSPQLVQKINNISIAKGLGAANLEIDVTDSPLPANTVEGSSSIPTPTASNNEPMQEVELDGIITKDNENNSGELPFKDGPPKVVPVEVMSLVPEYNMSVRYSIPNRSFKSNPDKSRNFSNKAEERAIGEKIVETLRKYGHKLKLKDWQRGPNVTQYEVEVLEDEGELTVGVKLSRITSLTDELRLYLAAKRIRIVAPIPGKSTIGIEVPNRKRDDVFLGDILRENDDIRTSSDLSIVIGKGLSGDNVKIDLNKLPHLLIAGTTGSGKSVAINSMICSLIYSKSPEDLRLIMIDPKMVEMALYEDIPHLLMPVITDPRKASKALYWAVQEMEARYTLVSELRTRDLKSYNHKIASGLVPKGSKKHKKLPYIIIFIDELSDLMMVSGKELEDYITRISQKSRAVGIHLVMATQRPSVDVITGLIKANCPARIAFYVAQKTDSKIILDYSGADSLLGQGDFLYKSPSSSDLQRIQAPYVSEEEIEVVVESAKKYGKPKYVAISFEEDSSSDDVDEGDEALFEEAWEIVRTEQKASASYLQRRLRIGYNKAARLMELMEERGYVGPQIGSKPREILRS